MDRYCRGPPVYAEWLSKQLSALAHSPACADVLWHMLHALFPHNSCTNARRLLVPSRPLQARRGMTIEDIKKRSVPQSAHTHILTHTALQQQQQRQAGRQAVVVCLPVVHPRQLSSASLSTSRSACPPACLPACPLGVPPARLPNAFTGRLADWRHHTFLLL
jgi:hypothetical protein